MKEQLDNNLARDPRTAIELVNTYWAPRFETTYRSLSVSDNTSDIDKILDEVAGRTNPIAWAKDKLLEAVLKSYLPRISAVVAIADLAAVQGAMLYFWPSRIAGEDAEIRSANKDINERLFSILRPALSVPLQPTYVDALRHADPRFAGPSIHQP